MQLAMSEQTIQAHMEVDAKAQRVNAYQEQLSTHRRAVVNVNGRLALIEARRAFLTGRIAQLKAQTLNLWTLESPNVVGQLTNDPLASLVEAHASIISLTSALSDFDSVKRAVEVDLLAAKKVLAQFERTAPR